MVLTCTAPVFAQAPSPAADGAERAMSNIATTTPRCLPRMLAAPDESATRKSGIALAMEDETDAIAPSSALDEPKLTSARMFLGSSYLAINREGVAPLKEALTCEIFHREQTDACRGVCCCRRPADDDLHGDTGSRRAIRQWFALGHACNGVAQVSMATFNDKPDGRGVNCWLMRWQTGRLPTPSRSIDDLDFAGNGSIDSIAHLSRPRMRTGPRERARRAFIVCCCRSLCNFPRGGAGGAHDSLGGETRNRDIGARAH